jgi:hypothetical protein
MSTANSKPCTLQESFTICLQEIDEVVVEARQRLEESQRIDDLLRIIGVAHARTLEETVELQKEHEQERDEYQALQDAYRLTQRRISAVAAQARQCLVNGFPATEQISNEFETLTIRYGKMEVRSDIFILKLRGLIQKASESISQVAVARPAASQKRTIRGSGRGPDLETSGEWIALYNQLSTELAAVHSEVKRFTTVEKLKMKYPGFRLWEMLSEPQQGELLGGEFRPRAYARSLTLHQYGLTSPATLKKDRKKLRRAQERPAAP